MKTSHKPDTGISDKTKTDYAEIYLTHVPIKHQRCIGITEDTLDKLKSVVRLIAQNNTTVRSYVSAILREHLKEYKFLHEIMRKVMYDKLMPGDLAIYQSAGGDYLETYLCPDSQKRGSAWIHVDVECAEALKQIVSWADTGATIGSFAESIILVHLWLNEDLLEQMKSDVYNSQP